MKGLRISRDFVLPIEVAGEAVAILAKRGAGKTNTATVLTEELVRAGVQTVILDPVGGWWGLRSSADGQGAGLGIPILGGQHGDVPLEQTAGTLIADVAIDTRQSLLIDLSELPSKAAVGRFVTDFAERLYRRKRSDSVLHLVLEEADSFAPQKVRGSERMQGAIEQIVRRGRSRGLGVTLITQRSAVLSKDVLTQADLLVVMRTTGPHDLRAIREWVDSRGDDERGREVLDSLPGLSTGEAWIWNPERDLLQRTKIRTRETFDSSRTPKAGERREEPTAVAEIDLRALGNEIQATAEKVRADDPRELRKRISELERELALRPTEEVVREVTVEVQVPVLDGELPQIEKAASDMRSIAEMFSAGKQEMLIAAENISKAILASGASVPRVSAPPPLPKPVLPLRPRVTERPTVVSDGELKRPEQKVVDAVAWLESMGLAGEKQRVGFLAGYSPGSGNFNNILGQLRSRGIVDYPTPGVIALTETGHALAAPPPTAITSAELQAKVMEKLKGPQRRVLEVVLDAWPHSLPKQDLADAVGYSAGSGNFNNILGGLRSLGLIDYPTPGWVVAESVLFIE